MGLVRKADLDSVAVTDGGSIDITSLIRRAVADEIKRQKAETPPPDPTPGEDS